MNSPTDIKIPGYRIEKLLGKGGMATVYLATQLSLGRSVALKILNDPETPLFFERFFNEGRCISKLSHPNLVTIYDIGQGEGFYYIAMEYISGGDLKTRIRQGFKTSASLKIISRLALCLSYVHAEGVIHRDIKPSNILFRDDGSPVLADFGIAKLIQTDNDLTLTGTVMGSPHYLSPEQAQGTPKLDGRSDLYSLGVILFELLTGKKPFTAESFAATLIAHIKNPIPDLPEKFSPLQPLINKLLAKKPEERFQNGTELAKNIQQFRTLAKNSAKQMAGEPAITKPSNTQHPRVLLIPAIVVGVLAISALPLFWPSSDTPQITAKEPAPQPTEPTPEITIAPEVAVEAAPHIVEEPLPMLETAKLEEPKPLIEESAQQTTPQLEQLLIRADSQFTKNQLSYPSGESAKDLYRAALKLDPSSKAAKTGLSRIADKYLLFAQSQLKKGNRPKALRSVRLGLSIRPKHKGLKKLEKRVTAKAKVVPPKPKLQVVPPPEKPKKETEPFDWEPLSPEFS